MPAGRRVAGSGPDSGAWRGRRLRLSDRRLSPVRDNFEICRGTNRRRAARSGGGKGGASTKLGGGRSLSFRIRGKLCCQRHSLTLGSCLTNDRRREGGRSRRIISQTGS